MIQIDHQQRTATLVDLRRSQRLLGAVSEQQAIGQIGQRVVMSQVLEFMFGVLDRADVGKHRHVMAEPAQIVVNDADGLPLRVDFAAFAPVPDFPAPLADAVECGEHRLIESRRMMAGLEQTGSLAEHFFTLITGDLHEGAVHMDDQPLDDR